MKTEVSKVDYTVIYSVPLNQSINAAYRISGPAREGEYAVVPLNSTLASKIEDNSNVHVLVVVVSNTDAEKRAQECIDETRSVLEGKNCNIDFECIRVPFASTSDVIGRLYLDMLSNVHADSTILADITYGTKYIPILITCFMDYAVRFHDNEVESVLYGHAEFDKEKNLKSTQLCDVSSVYLISSFGRHFGSNREEYDRFLKEFEF